MAYESPHYEVVDRIGAVEIRDYDGYLVAETEVSGPLERAGNAGFRTLARFIFGANSVGQAGSRKIAMTTPVTQEPSGDRFTVRFMMPREYTASTIPTPTDDRVAIREVAPHRAAVIRYRGSWSAGRYEQHLGTLRRELDEAGRSAIGDPVWARYDPPWTPWFLRRNEIMLRVERPADRGL